MKKEEFKRLIDVAVRRQLKAMKRKDAESGSDDNSPKTAVSKIQTVNDYTRNMISTLYDKAESGDQDEIKKAAEDALKYAKRVVALLEKLAK